MRQFTLTGRYSEAVTPFKDVRTGQTFILIEPPDRLRPLKDKVLIKMSATRIQELSDDNLRITVFNPGPAHLVYIDDKITDSTPHPKYEETR